MLEVCGVGVDYDRAFAEVILPRWNETSDRQRKAPGFSDRRGQLAPHDHGSYALHDTYKYQPGHADVFCEVFKKAPHVTPRMGERLLVIDIGAGAATVAVGLSEALELEEERERVDYLAFDPNPTMQMLGKQILRHLGAGFNSAEYVSSLEDVDFTNADRVLFTFSYVVHQDAITPTDIEKWASLIKRAVDEVDRDVELIYTTAKRRKGAQHPLRRALRHANILKDEHDIDVQVPMRYPDPDSSEGQVCWDEKSSCWKVRAEHWILST